MYTHTLYTLTKETKKNARNIYPPTHRGLTREKNEDNKEMIERYNIQERSSRKKKRMISYERKKRITSREGKEERKNREELTVKAMPVTQ